MARSYDQRKHPAGPLAGPDNVSTLRGPKRKIVGRVTPGDDIEVSREIERLWEWHNRLWAENSRLTKYIAYLINLLRTYGLEGLEVDYASQVGLQLRNGQATFPSTNGAVTLSGDLRVGTYRANYESGYRLQATVICALSDVDEMHFRINNNTGAFSPSFTGGVGSSTGGTAVQIPWWTMTNEYTGSDLGYDEEAYISLHWDTQLAISQGALGDGTLFWRWVQESDGEVTFSFPGEGLPIPTVTDEQSALVYDPATLSWKSATDLDVTARTAVRLNSAGTVYERRRINFVEGAGIDLTFVDDAGDEEVDVTFTVDLTELTLPDPPGRLNAAWYGTPAAGGTRHIIIPRGPGDVVADFDLERLVLRTETPSSSGSVSVQLQSSAGGNSAPSWSVVDTVTLAVSDYEASIVLTDTFSTGDLLRLYFTATGTGCTDYQAILTGTRQ
jgi:hypothetical protein